MTRQLWISAILSLLFVSGYDSVALHPSSPSSITITRYAASNPSDKTTYRLTGAKMKSLYKAILEDERHVVPKNATFSCPSYSSGMHIWDYKITIHFTDGANQTFAQSTSGCTFVKNERTGALSEGALPGLSPYDNSKTN